MVAQSIALVSGRTGGTEIIGAFVAGKFQSRRPSLPPFNHSLVEVIRINSLRHFADNVSPVGDTAGTTQQAVASPKKEARPTNLLYDMDYEMR